MNEDNLTKNSRIFHIYFKINQLCVENYQNNTSAVLHFSKSMVYKVTTQCTTNALEIFRVKMAALKKLPLNVI